MSEPAGYSPAQADSCERGTLYARLCPELAAAPAVAEAFEQPRRDVLLDVRRRVGVDLSPIDVRTDAGARLRQSYVWPDQTARLDRGDFVDVLPGLLERWSPDALTVVSEIAANVYVAAERCALVREALARARATGPLAWISTRRTDEMETGERDRVVGSYFELEVGLWPEQPPRLAAVLGLHRQWLDWRKA